jgi:hypothetical protein
VQLKKQPLSIRKSMTPNKMLDLQSQIALIQKNKQFLLNESNISQDNDSYDSVIEQVKEEEY